MLEFVIQSIDDIDNAANWILENIGSNKQVAFYGEMGVGKTTIIKKICEKLGSADTVSSPTFSIINEYQTENDELIYHFDFYRIEKREEVFEFGFEEYLASDYFCFMEWPERIEEILPDSVVKAILREDDSGRRFIQLHL